MIGAVRFLDGGCLCYSVRVYTVSQTKCKMVDSSKYIVMLRRPWTTTNDQRCGGHLAGLLTLGGTLRSEWIPTTKRWCKAEMEKDLGADSSYLGNIGLTSKRRT